MAKMKEGSKAFKQELINLLLSKHEVYSCQGCGHPVIRGYVCNHCNCESPVDRNNQEPYREW